MNKPKSKKRARIGSDDYALDLEQRVQKLEGLESRLLSEILKRDEKIQALESELESYRQAEARSRI